MIALYIILGVLLLLFLVLLIRVELLAIYGDSLTLVLKILFVRITLVSPDKKPKEKPQKKPKEQKPKQPKKQEDKKKEKKPSYLAKLKEKKGLSGIVSLLTQLASIAAGALKGLFSHIVVKRFDVGIALSGDDAAATAVNYGRLCSVVYPAIDIIVAATVCRDYHVSIEPVFDPDRPTAVSADVHVYLRVIFAVAEALKAAFRLLLVRLRL